MSKNLKNKGTLVISLDFELMWGMFDKDTRHYQNNIRNVHEVVPKLLKLFTDYNIHATWATVGMLMTADQHELDTSLPDAKPKYKNSVFSSYDYLQNNELDQELHFAPGLVKKIIEAEGQELASHTFSHYYCLEKQTENETSRASFIADCRAQKNIFQKFNQIPTSIVFPRNQWSDDALEICKGHAINAYRGNEDHFLYQARNETQQTKLWIRGLRLLDHYFNLSGHHTYSLNSNVNITIKKPLNIPASRFLRPYSKRLRTLEPLRLRRIKKAMTHAARRGEVFHLWWHPHNFGVNQTENFTNLTKLLEHYETLQKKYEMQSKNMHELTRENE